MSDDINMDKSAAFFEAQTHAKIDLDALSHNVRALKAHVGEKVRLAAAVKANAYGHGAVPVAREALKAGASYLLAARVEEGIQLRRAGINAPILVMGNIAPANIGTAIEHGLTLTITNEKQVSAAAEAADARGVEACVHIKADTGMNRNGADRDAVVPLAMMIARHPALRLEGLYTHFACADEPDKTPSRKQFDIFKTVCGRLADAGVHIPVLHAANSAAAIDLPETRMNMVRCGLAIYGLYGSPSVSRSVGLKPVMTLFSRVERVHDLRPGDGVSYGFDFTASAPTRAALVAIGYGDGYRRQLSGRAEVLVKGRRAKILGRICMDQCVVNVDEIAEAETGDRVTLMGEDGNERISALELAEIAGTNEYDIVTGLSARVPRLYYRNRRFAFAAGLNGCSPDQSESRL
jgi:alanine racemase